MKTKSLFIIALSFAGLVSPRHSFAQIESQSSFEEKYVETRGITLHYIDFGGNGTPIIFVQSFHEDASEWINWRGYKDFARQFTDSNRVYAVTRRGFGKSTNTGWGYDVATQSEDLIGFMDALSINKAILVGRNPAYQDILWMADHYPNRLAGMVFIDQPIVIPDTKEPSTRELVENIMSLACDLGDKRQLITMSRASWRPHFFFDQEKKIKIPSLLFVDPAFANAGSPFIWQFENILQNAEFIPFCTPQLKDYFVSISKNQEKKENLMALLKDADQNEKLLQGLKLAVGNYLREVDMPALSDDHNMKIVFKELREIHIPIIVKSMKDFADSIN